jgi:hypothetical protein
MRTSLDSEEPGSTAFNGGSAAVSAPSFYTNPVIDADFPDPALIHAPDGYYYAYATQT